MKCLTSSSLHTQKKMSFLWKTRNYNKYSILLESETQLGWG